MFKAALAALVGGAVLSTGGLSAKASLIPTTAFFFTAAADGVLTFTYEGYSADDTNRMFFTADNGTLFVNSTTAPGSVIQETVAAGQRYLLGLQNDTIGAGWSSQPALNSDGLPHLASTGAFSDFHLAATAPIPVNVDCAIPGRCYLGWEDLAGAADNDFNDLVFAMQFTAIGPAALGLTGTGDPIPEPITLLLFGSALLGFCLVRTRGVQFDDSGIKRRLIEPNQTAA